MSKEKKTLSFFYILHEFNSGSTSVDFSAFFSSSDLKRIRSCSARNRFYWLTFPVINLIGQKKLFTLLFSVWGHLRPEIEEESKWRSMIWFAPNSFISYRKRVNEICRRKFSRCLKCSSASDGNQRTNYRPERKWALYWKGQKVKSFYQQLKKKR